MKKFENFEKFEFYGFKYKAQTLSRDILNIVKDKGTEAPFSVELKVREKGTYLCRCCGTPLFLASSQFESKCGWPSFDICIEPNVKECLDIDGVRHEVICNNCHSHLGHVFYGENLTQKNTRYCINSLSIEYISKVVHNNTEEVILAGGCFWGVEYLLQDLPGVLLTQVGYMGGNIEKPSYEDVCSGTTGHVEVLRLIFDPSKNNLTNIYKYFLEIHNPFQEDGQGPDIGSQYLSIIFYENKKQQEAALEVLDELSQKHSDNKIFTKIKPAEVFWPAENYHQKYYEKSNGTPYCHIYKKLF